MRAITVDEYGAVPALTEMPDPQPGPGQVLIKTEAAGMNPMDRTIADGGWKEAMPASFPLILGADLAGVIEGPVYAMLKIAPEIGPDRPDRDPVDIDLDRGGGHRPTLRRQDPPGVRRGPMGDMRIFHPTSEL